LSLFEPLARLVEPPIEVVVSRRSRPFGWTGRTRWPVVVAGPVVAGHLVATARPVVGAHVGSVLVGFVAPLTGVVVARRLHVLAGPVVLDGARRTGRHAWLVAVAHRHHQREDRDAGEA